jgi:hypothetical protein
VLYRDYNGEWFGLDDLFVAAVGFVVGYVSHGISTGHWGKDAFVSGAIAAGSAWLTYNTAGAVSGLLTKAGVSQGLSTVIGNGIGGAVGSFAGNIAGQAYFTGSIEMNQVWQSTLYGLGGGISSGLVDISPIAKMKFPMHHTVQHMIRSTAYEIGGNFFTGRSIFKNLTYGLNSGMIIPVALDIASITVHKWGFRVMKNKIRDFVKSELGKLRKQGFSFDGEFDIDLLSADIRLIDFNGESGLGLYAEIRSDGYLHISNNYLDLTFPLSGIIDINIPLVNRFGYSIYNHIILQSCRRWR